MSRGLIVPETIAGGATFIERARHRFGPEVDAVSPMDREEELARARAIIASSEPVVQEAESYDLDVTEATTLLRQARDILAKGDTGRGLAFARNAEDVVLRLGPQILRERQRRGILRPARGVCGACGSDRLQFHEDGGGTCLACGRGFWWRSPPTILERLRALLGT